MTTPTDRPDTGLPEAVRRVDDVLTDRVGWVSFGTDTVEAVALAARADYPDVVRNAKAEAWDEGVRAQFQTYDRLEDDSERNPYREGRTDERA
jgi:hypothetical protein